MLTKSVLASPDDVDSTQGIIKGYFAHFGTKDSDGDIIQKSAFDKTIRENGPTGTNRIKHYLNHDSERPLGAMKEMGADAVGLAYVSQLLKYKGKFIPDAEVVLAGIESGYSLEHSIGYWVPTGKSEKTDDGNLLHEIGLYEGSTLTKHGANGNTPVTGLKHLAGADALDLLHYYEKSLRNGNWSDEYYALITQKHAELTAFLSEKGFDTKDLTTAEKAQKRFLAGMIPHHEMALTMAAKVKDDARLGSFAKSIISTQSKEITQMTTWLKEWFDAAPPAGHAMPKSRNTTEPGTPTQPEAIDYTGLLAKHYTITL